MRKIGILTYHPYDNYGAVLQAYALQSYISKHYNDDVEIIDFCTDDQKHDNDILQLRRKKTIRSIISTLFYKLPIYFQLRRKRKRFDLFRKENLYLTPLFKDSLSLFANLPRKDIFITGSDQVFNPYSKYTEIYYLGFEKGKAKKVAYAPSFGVSDMEKSVTAKLQEYLRDFDALSCREQTGADYLSQLLGIKVPCVADPVFLLSKEEWLKVAVTPPNVDNRSKYILVYRLNGGSELMRLAKKVGRIKQLPIICVANEARWRKGAQMEYSSGPSELLGLINNADCVITDSFHGTSLSIVFEREIITYIANTKTSGRITSIMGIIGLTSNIVYNVDDFNYNNIIKVDYSKKLNSYISLSSNFLNSVLL